jgi:hypothetical protein
MARCDVYLLGSGNFVGGCDDLLVVCSCISGRDVDILGLVAVCVGVMLIYWMSVNL